MENTSLVVDCRGLSAALSVLRVKQAMSCYEEADSAFGVVIDPDLHTSVSDALGPDGSNVRFMMDEQDVALSQLREMPARVGTSDD
ncbi:hypothetical protein HDIA_1425 [Hartmannibacter diazotrophicus]|uniref:Uncharacterized protein n=1 Tax=Hartmannibacter diazotrophicus TaxID=1482074 RepID=A0A2C9D3W9_9HYPH|nr:hypothetical protein [Hartmannibacter diazotrophicus]SON54966.1 hypothetical protein HDIA_1425 [Hartmannibacter diazotrophicus]